VCSAMNIYKKTQFLAHRKIYGRNAFLSYRDFIRAGTIQPVSIQYRYRRQPIRIDTVILSYRYTDMMTAAKIKQLFWKESTCFLKTKSLNIYHHLSV